MSDQVPVIQLICSARTTPRSLTYPHDSYELELMIEAQYCLGEAPADVVRKCG